MSDLVVGVDLGGTNIRVGIVSNGIVVEQISRPVFAKGDGREEIFQNLIELIDAVKQDQIVGIGMGIPGLIERSTGIIHELTNIPSWNNFNVKEELEKRYKVPVYLENDANCFALGERFFGKGKQVKNFVGLTLGTGLGTGIVNGGSMLKDRNSGAGEFGMIPYLDSNYEAYCSSKFFINKHKTTGIEEFVKAQKGDENAQQIFSEFGYHLASVIQTILYSIDPELIILGGSIAKANSFFHHSLMTHLAEFPSKRVLQNLRIEYSDLNHSALLGAAAVFFDRINDSKSLCHN